MNNKKWELIYQKQLTDLSNCHTGLVFIKNRNKLMLGG